MKDLMIDLLNMDKGEEIDITDMNEETIDLLIHTAWFDVVKTNNKTLKKLEVIND